MDKSHPEPAGQRPLEPGPHAVPDPPDSRAGRGQQHEAQARHEVRHGLEHDPRPAHVQQPRRVPIAALRRLGHGAIQRLQAPEPLPRHRALDAVRRAAALRHPLRGGGRSLRAEIGTARRASAVKTVSETEEISGDWAGKARRDGSYLEAVAAASARALPPPPSATSAPEGPLYSGQPASPPLPHTPAGESRSSSTSAPASGSGQSMLPQASRGVIPAGLRVVGGSAAAGALGPATPSAGAAGGPASSCPSVCRRPLEAPAQRAHTARKRGAVAKACAQGFQSAAQPPSLQVPHPMVSFTGPGFYACASVALPHSPARSAAGPSGKTANTSLPHRYHTATTMTPLPH